MLRKEHERRPIVDQGLSAIAINILEASRQQFESMNFGPYRLLDILGEGGMGVVYLAEHKNNGMLVAIKILIDAQLSPARRERFALEQRMLAELDHPNIARLYHADFLEDSTPWFAMEYIGERPDATKDRSGALPLLDYCDHHACGMEQRLRLFRQVCEAVRFVHSKMLVHRDLKPSNILMTAAGVPKLIDFGIGKEWSEKPADVSLTVPGLRLMTLAYAAPEQLRGGAALPSGDIYALGVVLYQLLTGRHPFDFSACSTSEAEKKVLDEAPPKPSQAALESGVHSRASRSQWRDLDALCMKAMHKSEERRYASVESLIHDLTSYLAGRPLQARPDGFVYHASKFGHRNWRSLAAIALTVIAVISGVVYYTISLKRARDRAVAEEVRTARIEDFMQNMLKNGDDEVGPKQQMKVDDLVDRGVKEAQAMDHDPEVQADLYDTFGGIYESWGKYTLAFQFLDQARRRREAMEGADGVKVADSLFHLAQWHQDQDHLAEAEQLLHKALAIQTHRLGPTDAATARSMTMMGLVSQRRGDYKQSISVLEQAIAIQSKRSDSLVDLSASISLLANDYYYLNDFDRSWTLNEQGLELDRKIHGDRHPDIAEDLISLGNLEFTRSHFAESEKDYRKAWEIDKTWYGPTHASTADAEMYVAKALIAQQRLADAQTLLAEALDALEHASEGEARAKIGILLNERGKLNQRQKNWAAAEADYRRAIDIFSKVYGEEHTFVLIVRSNLDSIAMDRGNYTLAEKGFRELLAAYGKVAPKDDVDCGVTWVRLGHTLLLEKRYPEAETALVKGLGLVGAHEDASSNWVRDGNRDLVQVRQQMQLGHRTKIQAAEASSLQQFPHP